MKRSTTLLFLLLFFSFAYSQKTLVFFGSYNWEKSNKGIYVYELDTIKGKLIKKSAFAGIKNPSFLTLSADGNYLFSCTDSKTENGGSVSSFKIDTKQGKISFINTQPSGGENPVYVSVHKNGKWLVSGNYSEGSISVYPISENGSIQPFVQNFHFEEGSIDKNRQDRSHIHSTVFSPDFDYLFCPDLGSDKIRTYHFDASAAEPLKAAKIPFTQTTLGSGPRHLIFHPNGKFAYCIEEMGSTVSIYDYIEGRLISIQRINTHLEKTNQNFESSDIHISPDGKFLYASNRGSKNDIAIFSIQNDGTLQTVGYQPTLGKHPRTFALDESGKFLIAINTQTSDVFIFRRNFETGLLKKSGKRIKIKNVSNVQVKRYSE